jgi:hypothetical protein
MEYRKYIIIFPHMERNKKASPGNLEQEWIENKLNPFYNRLALNP